jgi:hypothetical protein
MYFTVGTKDDELVYVEIRKVPTGPVIVILDLTPDEAEPIGQSLVDKARYLRAKKNT